MSQHDTVRDAHERFVTTGRVPGRHVRRLVADSWRRSARSGVDPEVPAPPVDMVGRTLTSYRRGHPLAVAMPVVRDLLVRPGHDAGWVAALTDDAGRLLWVEGDRDVRHKVEGVGFVEGAVWREDCTGTNALGTALATDRAVQVVGTEHYARRVQPWNCAAAPVRAASGQVLGVLDVTGGPVVASGLVMSLVRATVAAVEAELARAARPGVVEVPTERVVAVLAAGGASRGAPTPGRLRVLGPAVPTVRLDGRDVRLGLRHAEILLLLAHHPAGLTAEQLAVLLSADALSDVTVRAEVSRLRRVVGPLLSHSRPYRLTVPLRTDLDTVHELLEVGDVVGALANHPGLVLPRSVAPGVERLRDDLQADLRAAVLASPEPGVLSRWVASDEGSDDWQAWQRLAVLAPRGTPAQVQARGRLDLLARRLAGRAG
ncbi:GAF domain-containing protein [Cellulomonas biazotea]|uniref:Putative transcriptional regulator n=1 Tax=Cellulomonas biazotea TaxID=1709 RepID=A0A402DVU7_9CELL|nr:GAF domain-containing protein [Cellulomonas biazotea]GCE78269.1 putative transcriptional regulator [Cellulomonas biazotea]